MRLRPWLASLRRRLKARRNTRSFICHRSEWHGHSAALSRIECLENRALLAVDFGDAPAPVATLLADDGARHEDTGPVLGSNRDTETDGQPTAAADGDDTNGAPDDEDGVVFPALRVGELAVTVTVTVSNAPSGAKLDAWLDMNADGAWGGPFKQIADNVTVANGSNAITFDVPSWAVAGTTYARFRLSTAGDVAPTGLADDGEVEDYQVAIDSPLASDRRFGAQNVISSSTGGAWAVFAADVDGDGDMDALSAARDGDAISWHENTGSESFSTHAIATGVDGASAVFAADVDGDGDVDVLSSAYYGDRVTWYENDGSQNFTPHSISSTANGAFSVSAADLDADGDLDVLTVAAQDDTIAWYENDGDQNFTQRVISDSGNLPTYATTGDVDGDGDLDVWAVFFAGPVVWYSNTDGDGTFGAAQTIMTGSLGDAFQVVPTDLDGDGDLDAVACSAALSRVVWAENNGTGSFGAQQIITSSADDVFAIFATDLDGDGDMDVMSASRDDDKIAWYENDGDETFTAHNVNSPDVDGNPFNGVNGDANDARSVFAADVDGDGDLDVLSASRGDNKIAWYENIGFEFGDAPAPYPTTLAEFGAQHDFSGPQLGTNRDDEPDGSHSIAADGDDVNGLPDDEDGVTFPELHLGEIGVSLAVTVANAPSGAKLDAWLDFNADGSWGGPFEQIANNVSVVNGSNSITVDVPSWAVPGTTYARFRLSTAGNLPPGGEADDGEVEDYAVTLLPPERASGVFGAPNLLSTSQDGAVSVVAVDLDGDGDSDVVAGSRYDNEISWYENDGTGSFTAHTITTTYADRVLGVTAADVDGDGDMDVLSASYRDDRIAWYENDGNQNFTPHDVNSADPDGAGAGEGDTDAPFAVFAADLDADGDMDVLSASIFNDRISWYENDGNQNFTTRTIDSNANGALSVYAADVDGDGDLDALSASLYDDKIAWYENDGSPSDGGWIARTISVDADRARSVFAVDLDRDGDTDVLSASENDDKIAWYENDGSENFTPHNVNTPDPDEEISNGVDGDADQAMNVFVTDIDGDGDLDVLSASFNDDQIAWYINDGNQSFTRRTITTSADGARAVFAADLDGDGDLDALSASTGNDTIAWYENRALDFGDAPAPYATTLSSNGARHVRPDLNSDGLDNDGDGMADGDDSGDEFGPFLGTNRDIDTDGVPSTTANGDDTTDVPDDEDGVTFGSIRVGQLGASVTVHIGGVNPNDPGPRLDAWIDFNADGSWGGTGEQIADNVLLDVTGMTLDHVISFDVPSWAVAGTTYARFRLSTAGNLAPTGEAADGEVEEYQLTISDPVLASGVFGPQQVISTVNGAWAVYAADIDGDGDMDAVSAAYAGDRVDWHENNGDGTFTTHPIAADVSRAVSVFAADVDGDGDTDVLSAAYQGDTVVWYENDGDQNFTAHPISTTANGAFSVSTADLDGDGDVDVLSASGQDDTVAWYRNDGSQNFTRLVISDSENLATYATSADVDGDGDLDVLATSFFNRAVWFPNTDGAGTFGSAILITSISNAFQVVPTDLDGDGDLDAVVNSRAFGRVVWAENLDGAGTFGTQQVISTTASGVFSVGAADLDGDGDIDVLSASRYDDKVAWYENDGNESFTAHNVNSPDPDGESTGVDGDANSANWVHAADVDGDGDLDVLSASTGDSKIAWYENQGFDFGDAPAAYPTNLAESGARHDPAGPQLGSNRDDEQDGVHSAGANADDLAGVPDDEDGTTFAAELITSASASHSGGVTVNVSADAKLDAWIDFNQDGDWNDTGEQVFDDLDVTSGDNLLTFTIPAGALPGQTVARFRVSSAGVSDPQGPADDGEVEDSLVTFRVAAVQIAVNGSGQLTLIDIEDAANDLTISLDTGTAEFVISSSSSDLSSDGLTLTSEVRVPVSTVTGGLSVELRGGDDVLDFSSLTASVTVLSGDGQDTVLGGVGQDSISGGAGLDLLPGGSGNDTLQGDEGNDVLTGGLGDDSLAGGSGADILTEAADFNMTVTNTSLLMMKSGVAPGTDTLDSLELLNLTGGTSRNRIDASGFVTSNGPIHTIVGAGGVDTIIGTNGRDRITTFSSGTDSIQGMGGDDSIFSGNGNDTIDGGAGNDQILGQNGDDSILEATASIRCLAISETTAWMAEPVRIGCSACRITTD